LVGIKGNLLNPRLQVYPPITPITLITPKKTCGDNRKEHKGRRDKRPKLTTETSREKSQKIFVLSVFYVVKKRTALFTYN
jgi:hypothetical protein